MTINNKLQATFNRKNVRGCCYDNPYFTNTW